ncbi:MAG: stage III sporulation protein AH [Longicatena sp.]
MNKQALAFLTMFSLVLMLSVYYVTLPTDSKSVMSEKRASTSDNKKESETKSTSESKAVTNLQTAINQKKDTEINKQSDIVANAQSDEAKKQSALTTIDTLKAQVSEQEAVVQALTKAGYKNAVEIQKTSCIVTIFEQKDEKSIAQKVMQKASELTNNKYLIEVTFK